ncbi:MAG TPA: hypothetical protein VFB82_20365 [Blastocatellia bacterium]|nr:hypothetical protein [Blastocatellia bacterium]
MSEATPSRLARLRSLCAALFLLAAAVSAPIALASRSADVCGMACCINAGTCCCNPRHAGVQGHASDDKPHIREIELSASCPQGCTTSVRSSNLVLRDPRPPGEHTILGLEAALIYSEQAALHRNPFVSGSSTPRAPPASSTI